MRVCGVYVDVVGCVMCRNSIHLLYISLSSQNQELLPLNRNGNSDGQVCITKVILSMLLYLKYSVVMVNYR